MAFELVYTSASQGLRLGSVGFCTVARHENIPDGLVLDLEKLSGFDLPPGIENVQAIYSFLTIERPTGKYWVFCRKRVCEIPDYSGRSNYIAHHLILDEEEVERLSNHRGLAITPASILLTFSWRSEFEGEAHMITEERTLKSIFEAAFHDKDTIHDVRQLLGDQCSRREEFLRIPLLFKEEIEPKPACFIDSSLHSEAGSRKLLKLLHCATLISSPWLGENCAEDLFPGTKYPLQPRKWWDWGLTTMLIHNDKSSRYSWIGISEERGAIAAGTTRLVLRLDQWPTTEASPQILKSLVEEPESIWNQPERIRMERRISAHEKNLRAEFARLQEAKQLVSIEFRTLKPRYEEYQGAHQALEADCAKAQELVTKLEDKLNPIIGKMPPANLQADFEKYRRFLRKTLPLKIWEELCQKFRAISRNVERGKEMLRSADESYANSRVGGRRKLDEWDEDLRKFRGLVTAAADDLGEEGVIVINNWLPQCEDAERRFQKFEGQWEESPEAGGDSFLSASNEKFEEWQTMTDWIRGQFSEEERTERAQLRKAWLVKNKKWVLWGVSLAAGVVLVWVAVHLLFPKRRVPKDSEPTIAKIDETPTASPAEKMKAGKAEQLLPEKKQIPGLESIGLMPSTETPEPKDLGNNGTTKVVPGSAVQIQTPAKPKEKPPGTVGLPPGFTKSQTFLLLYELGQKMEIHGEEIAKSLAMPGVAICYRTAKLPMHWPQDSDNNEQPVMSRSDRDFFKAELGKDIEFDLSKNGAWIQFNSKATSAKGGEILIIKIGQTFVVCIPVSQLNAKEPLFQAEFKAIFGAIKFGNNEVEVSLHANDSRMSVRFLNVNAAPKIAYEPSEKWQFESGKLSNAEGSSPKSGGDEKLSLRIGQFDDFLINYGQNAESKIQAVYAKISKSLKNEDNWSDLPVPGNYLLVVDVKIKSKDERLLVFAAEAFSDKLMDKLGVPKKNPPKNK
jgi:hypothetical protein